MTVTVAPGFSRDAAESASRTAAQCRADEGAPPAVGAARARPSENATVAGGCRAADAGGG